jgi:hypothetical protein
MKINSEILEASKSLKSHKTAKHSLEKFGIGTALLWKSLALKLGALRRG